MAGALEVKVIGPVEKVDHNEGEGEGQPRVVIDIVWILYFATVHTAHDSLRYCHALGASVLRLRRADLLLAVARGGAASVTHPGQHLLPLTDPQGVAADGVDDAVHLILPLLHFLPILIITMKHNYDKCDGDTNLALIEN